MPALPASEDKAFAIQDAVAARLGEAVGGYKASLPAGEAPRRAPIYARLIHPSPAQFRAMDFPQLAVEAEIAFRFLRDLPPRRAPYTRGEVAAAVAALPAIEVVASRFRDPADRHPLERLADRMLNGALVLGAEVPAWSGRDFASLDATLSIDGEVGVQRRGSHPTGDTLGVVVALVAMLGRGSGVEAGQVAATGSWTDLRTVGPGEQYGD